MKWQHINFPNNAASKSSNGKCHNCSSAINRQLLLTQLTSLLHVTHCMRKLCGYDKMLLSLKCNWILHLCTSSTPIYSRSIACHLLMTFNYFMQFSKCTLPFKAQQFHLKFIARLSNVKTFSTKKKRAIKLKLMSWN